jgi:hypothetical protein
VSYVIHLWSQSHRPASYAQAESMLERLRETLAPETEASFRALVDQVSRHYGQSGDEDGSFVWNEMPEFRQRALLTLGLVTGELSTALPLILTAARQLGLALLDIQCGEVWLPEGLVLGAGGSRRVAGAAELQPADSRELSDFNVGEAVRTAIEPAMTSLGFQRGRGESWFVRKTRAFKISFLARIKWNHLSFWMPIEIKTPRNRPELKQYCEEWPLHVEFGRVARHHGLPCTCVPRLGGMSYELPTEDWLQVRASGREITQWLSSPAFRFLGEMNTVDDLAQWTLQVADAECPFLDVRGRTAENGLVDMGKLYRGTHPDLLIAHLTNNPGLVDMATARIRLCRQGLQPVGGRVAQRTEQFMQALGHAV